MSTTPPLEATSRTFLLTSVGALPGSGAVKFGDYGYSYHVAARRFEPLLARLGQVVWLDRSESRLDYAVHRACSQGQDPIALSFRPFQDHYPARSVPDVIYPFWEYPDLPDEPFGANPRAVWAPMARWVALILTASSFTAEALARAGVQTPVRVVPVPIPEEWFAVPLWVKARTALPPLTGHALLPEEPDLTPAGTAPPRFGPRWCWRRARTFYKARVQPRLPAALDRRLTGLGKACIRDLKDLARAWRRRAPVLPSMGPTVPLSGIVYTMVLQHGPRKALGDLMTAFVWALRDRADATLVLRVIARADDLPTTLEQVRAAYRSLAAIPHRCRIVLLTDPMSEAQMRQLAAHTTYYVNATRAEGACLPIQEMLAAGRPALSPTHSAMRDYFDASVGFVVDSHPEPCAYPQDPRQRLKTTCHRLVWQSLHDQFQASYALAQDPAAYQALAVRARQRMRDWASPERVATLLAQALTVVAPPQTGACGQPPQAGAAPRTEAAPRRGGTRPPVYIEAMGLVPREITGIGRYTVLLTRALARLAEVRLTAPFPAQSLPRARYKPERYPHQEIALAADCLPRHCSDLETWRDALLRLPKQPRDEGRCRESPGLFPFVKPPDCSFGRELGIVHDLTPLIVPGVAGEPLRLNFLDYCRRILPSHHCVLCDSQATRADVAWLSGIDPATLQVAYPGPSLCIDGHACTQPLRRSRDRLLVVGDHHPRKNGAFLFDWFWNTPALPPGMQLIWAGPNASSSKRALRPSRNPFHRRVRLLGTIPDAELCRLYQQARCLIYPSLYEGFGFPVLDALLHGTPVLCGRHSSLVEFAGPGVFYFDPCDPESVDRAFEDLRAAEPLQVRRDDLRESCSWERLAQTVLRLCA